MLIYRLGFTIHLTQWHWVCCVCYVYDKNQGNKQLGSQYILALAICAHLPGKPLFWLYFVMKVKTAEFSWLKLSEKPFDVYCFHNAQENVQLALYTAVHCGKSQNK